MTLVFNLLTAALGVEIIITLADFVVEDHTRRLRPSERILHTILAINFGMILLALAPTLLLWWSQPTAVTDTAHGTYSWLFSLFAFGAAAFSVRDALAVLRMRRPAEWVRDPIKVGTSSNARTVLITGATGFLGGHLVRRLLLRGERGSLLTRDAQPALDR